uniref:Coiled-coil domain-containing protein n=2 Tax=Caenorhabditis tropicalis TaxID=1561998 RepID=A0A1I7U4X8_9PELO
MDLEGKWGFSWGQEGERKLEETFGKKKHPPKDISHPEAPQSTVHPIYEDMDQWEVFQSLKLMACSSCDSVMERVKEKMVHIEQLRKEVLVNEQDYHSLRLKCQTLEKEKAFVEKQSGFLSRQIRYLRGENDRLMKLLCEKHAQCVESERLLDVIHKDRDECIEEKVRACKFYRNEMKKLTEDNAELRNDNNFLRKRNEEQLVANEEPVAMEDQPVAMEDQPVAMEDHKPVVSQDDKLAEFHMEFDKARQQMEQLIEKMNRLEMSIQKKEIPVTPEELTLEELLNDPVLMQQIMDECEKMEAEKAGKKEEEKEDFEIVDKQN